MSLQGMVAVAGLAAMLWAPVAAQAADFKTLYRFRNKNDGELPSAAMTYHDGQLYGLAAAGGKTGRGTLFVAELTKGPIRTLHHFDDGGFGEIPTPPLAYADGALYGAMPQGGASGNGFIYKVDVNSGHLSVLHALTYPADGGFPQSGVIVVGNMLYGTAQTGGSHDGGTLFKVDRSSGKYGVVYNFGADSADGNSPNGLLEHDGGLYGTTLTGSVAGANGILFRVDIKTGVQTRLYTFNGPGDGNLPSGSLAYHEGLFFGTTAAGGGANAGTLFQFDPQTAAETVLYGFHGTKDGGCPYAGVVYMGGTLYGTAFAGGVFNGVCKVNVDSGCGTLYAFNLATRQELTLYRFSGRGDGAEPYASLIAHGGALYGTTMTGGLAPYPDGFGSLFEVTP